MINNAEYESFKKLKIMKLTQHGSLALFDRNFITREHNQQEVYSIKHIDERKEILKHAFLIDPGFVDLYF